MHRWGALAGVAASVSAVVAVAWWFGFAGIGLFAGLGVALLPPCSPREPPSGSAP